MSMLLEGQSTSLERRLTTAAKPADLRGTGLNPQVAMPRERVREISGCWGQVFGDTLRREAEVEYLAVVTVEVDLESGEVVSLGIRATRDEDEVASQVGVSLESENNTPANTAPRGGLKVLAAHE